MKNYDEITKNLLERRDRYVIEKKKKRKTALGIASSLSCFCLIALLDYGMWQGDVFNVKTPTILDNSTIVDEENVNAPSLQDANKDNAITPNNGGLIPDNITPDNGDLTPNNGNVAPDNTIPNTSDSPILNNNPNSNDDPVQLIWKINRVEGLVGASKLNFDSDKYYSEKKTTIDVSNYLGKNLTSLENILPQGFKFIGNYETEFYYENNGKLAYDTCVFGYVKNEQQITIRASKIGVPYDCMYMMNNQKASNINGVDVIMGGIYENDNSETFKLVFADFSYAGIQYRVTIENLPSDGSKDSCSWLASIVAELTK